MRRILVGLTAFLLCLTSLGYAAENSSFKMRPPQNVDANMLYRLQHMFNELNEIAGKLTVIPTEEDYMRAWSRLKEISTAEFRDKPALGLMRVRLLDVLQAAIDLQHDDTISMGEKAALYLLSIESFNQMLESVGKQPG